MNIELSRSETIPFLDTNGQVMQMKNFELSVTVNNKDGETLEELQEVLDKEFKNQRDIVARQIPLLKSKDNKILFLLKTLKQKVSQDEYLKITDTAKTIK